MGDTCIWIDVERGTLVPADIMSVTGNEHVFLSAVTITELKYGAEIATDPGIRQKRLARPYIGFDASPCFASTI